MFISPMLLDSREKPFSDPSYVFEPKMDGHRLILSKSGVETRLFTRNHQDCTRQYPELCVVPVSGDVVLDGEVCFTDPETGQEDHELVMERLQLTKKKAIRSFAEHRPVSYRIWDILFLKGRDLRNLPLVRRRAILEAALQENDYFKLVPQTDGAGEELFRRIVEQSGEGMVAKRKGGLYVSRRSHDWLKIIHYREVNVWIGGFAKAGFGWLAYTEGDDGVRRPAGRIEEGMSPLQKKEFTVLSRELITHEDADYVYLEPQLQAKVKYRNWTRHGMLRDAVFVDFITS